MKHFSQLGEARAVVVGLLVCALVPAAAWALPPAPVNDHPEDAQVITGPFPLLVYGTTVLADDSISTTVLPSPASDVDGPDVFYSLTPDTAGTYRVQLWPWQHAPLRSSDRQFTIYILNEDSIAIAGARAPGSARPVYFDVTLSAGITYTIAVDYNATTHDNFDFALVVDALNLTNPDDCATAEMLGGPLPVVRVNDIDPALNDFAFEQGTGRCGVAGTTTAPGNDHVYNFTPTMSGDYAIELVSSGFDAVLYVNTACPPVYPEGCLGASNHSAGGTSGAKHELVVVTLEADVQYYIYVDNASTSAITGQYVLVIDDAFEYEINEIEPNDTAAEATPIATPLNGGQLVGPLDVDYWAVTGLAGDRVYAWVNNGGASNSTLDTDLAFLKSDGMTLIEFDDEDGDGADAPIEDLRYIYSTTSPVIAGARMSNDGTHFFEVTDQSDTGTVHRYRFHVGVIPATWIPAPECESNDSLDAADRSGKNYFAGAIVSTADHDFYAFQAEVGDRVFIAFDGDPERDSDGSLSANDDPLAFHGKLVVYDPEGDVLISDISDSNSAQDPPDYPAQGGFFVARTAGWHYVEVSAQSTASQVGPTETYELAVFLNDSAPYLYEDIDPLVALTPDYMSNTVAGTATELALGDSGICDVSLFNNTNLQVTDLVFTPGDTTVTFTVAQIDTDSSGFAKLLVTDCAGNTTCVPVMIDIEAPACDGYNYAKRTINHYDPPLYIPDNEPSGPGLDATLEIPDAGMVTDVNVTVTFETTSVSDLDIFLVAPDSTTVEIQTDRGSSSAFNMIDATFDDSAEETMPLLSSDEPYTGTWLPEGSLAAFNGHAAKGVWTLNVRDDSSSQNGGSRLVRWTLEVEGTFPGPETFAGTASDTQGFDAGIESIVLTDAVNVQLNLPAEFVPGDQVVNYSVTLIDPTQNGSGTITVTDLQANTCQSLIALAGLLDGTGPANVGGPTTDLTMKTEVQADLPPSDPVGATSTIIVPDSFLVNEVEVDLTIDTQDVGRLAATLTKGPGFASLINRVGMDERESAGLTKNTLWIYLDDDAPQDADAHMEPALGTIPFLGLRQPDGRGEFIGDGIDTDSRDNMLFALAGQSSMGGWKLQAADYRMMSSSRSEFRRWALTLKSPCGAERYVGRAEDRMPGSGIASIALAAKAANLTVVADFTPGAEVVDYRVELVDPTLAGSGTLEIADLAGNVTPVAIDLQPRGMDLNPPELTGDVNLAMHQFEGFATEIESGDTGVDMVELAPYADNLEIVGLASEPPNMFFVIGLVDPGLNGRGYVRVTDACGWRSYILVELDAQGPMCTGSVGTTKRYVSTDLPRPIPDYASGGVVSSIVVTDTDIISDVNVTLNITHPYDDDIDLTLVGPMVIDLFSDIGSTGNDFIDTTLDDEAEEQIPDSATAAPFTGAYQPEGGPALMLLDGDPAAGTYSLKVVDDAANNTGTFDGWSVTIESPTFPNRYDGRAADGLLYDSGICEIALLPGAANVALTTDPFAPGAAIVRYSVALVDPAKPGSAHVRVTDCAGNACEFPVHLLGTLVTGDINCDGEVDYADVDPFVLALSGEAGYYAAYPECDYARADFNGDGVVNYADIDWFVLLLTQQ